MEAKIRISQRLKQLRNKRGFTLGKIANLLGVKVSRYQHYENGRAAPPIHMLIRLSGIYGLTLDELVVGKTNPNTSKIEEQYQQLSSDMKKIVDFILANDC